MAPSLPAAAENGRSLMSEITIRKYTFGRPYATGAVISDVPEGELLPYFTRSETGALCLDMAPETVLYGLGPTVRGLHRPIEWK